MTTAVKEKKPFLPTRKPASHPGAAVTLSSGGGGSRLSAAANALVVGGEPRVHLLPSDVNDRKREKELKRRAGFAIVATLVLVGAAYGFLTVSLSTAQSQLAAAQAATTQLLTQQGKYGDVTKVQSDIAAIQTSQQTGTAQEILWSPYISSLEATLPAGASITTFTGSMDSPIGSVATAPAATVPLQGPHIATVQVTLDMVQDTIPGWLDELPTLKGFVDATPDSVTVEPNSDIYVVVVTIQVDSDALSNRFKKAAGASK